MDALSSGSSTAHFNLAEHPRHPSATEQRGGDAHPYSEVSADHSFDVSISGERRHAASGSPASWKNESYEANGHRRKRIRPDAGSADRPGDPPPPSATPAHTDFAAPTTRGSAPPLASVSDSAARTSGVVGSGVNDAAASAPLRRRLASAAELKDSSDDDGTSRSAVAVGSVEPTTSVQGWSEAGGAGKTKRRKRAILSCTECKQRKIKCDRNVPNCGSCVRRGVAHMCRWGDERDDIASAKAGSITPSNAALMARIAQLESQSSQSYMVTAAHAHRSRSPIEPDPRAALRDADMVARSEASDSPGSEDEDAAEVLEALARGTRLRKEHSPLPMHKAADGAEVSATRRSPTAQGKSAKPDSGQDDLKSDTSRPDGDGQDGPGLPLDQRPARAHQRFDDLRVLVGLLPSREAVSALIKIYISEAEPLVVSLHVPTLWAQLDAFWKRMDRLQQAATDSERPAADGKEEAPDLQFASLLFALVEGACEYLAPCEVLTYGICTSRDEICARLTLLVRASTALLSLDKFISNPTLCGFQAVVALRHYCFNREFRQEYIVLSTMAIKAAEVIGMHRLGNAVDDHNRWDEERRTQLMLNSDDGSGARVNPSNGTGSSQRSKKRGRSDARRSNDSDSEIEVELMDPLRLDLNAMFLPRGRQKKRWENKATARFYDHNHLQREIARKVWFALVTMDWLCGAFFDRCYHCGDEQFTTQTPQNIDDGALSALSAQDGSDDGNERETSLLDRVQPWYEPTDNSFVLVNVDLCRTVRSIADAQNRGQEAYDVVLQIDRRFRSILDNLPPFFRLDGETEYDPKVIQLHRARPYLALQRAVIYEFVHHRLLMLHRLYMGRGYSNIKYAYSTRTCIEGASVVIALLRCLDQVQSHGGSRGGRYWVYTFHLFHALLALQVDLVNLSSEPMHDEVLLKANDVMSGLKMMLARTDAEGRNPILAKSIDVIKSLRKEEKTRRARYDAQRTDETVVAREPSKESSTRARPGSGSDDNDNDATRRSSRAHTDASRDTGQIAAQLAKGILETWPNLRHPGKDYTASTPGLRRTSSAGTRPQASRQSSAAGKGEVRGQLTRLAAEDALPSGPIAPAAGQVNPREDAKPEEPAATTAAALGPAPPSDNPGPVPLQDDAPEGPVRQQDLLFDPSMTDLDGYLELLTSYQIPSEVSGAPNYFDVNVLDEHHYGTSMELAAFNTFDAQPASLAAPYGQQMGLFSNDGAALGSLMATEAGGAASANSHLASYNTAMLRPQDGFPAADAVGMGGLSGPATVPGVDTAAATSSGGLNMPYAELDAASIPPQPAGGWDGPAASGAGPPPGAPGGGILFNQPRPPPLNVRNLLSGDQ
ncbi:uncharacterized protein PSFLO_05687 [Pseudozyma flocculosa]|uniref:Zn(2)-C6 fungal-type domain-containing protein n=1 Tax=Pseudozyma flocculosa TaxID=84751 RepID=A0A5C3F999_9BASI|nr:uncharacterized protein PSFLO_05687 [Pseudozyma flocculosa]